MIRRFRAAGLLLCAGRLGRGRILRAHTALAASRGSRSATPSVTLLPIAQLASVSGVYGLSWLLATSARVFRLVALTSDGRRRLAAGHRRRRCCSPPFRSGARRGSATTALTRDGDADSRRP